MLIPDDECRDSSKFTIRVEEKKEEILEFGSVSAMTICCRSPLLSALSAIGMETES